MIAVIGFTVLIQAVPAPKVKAATIASLNDLTQKTRIYNEYMMLANNHCFWKGGLGADDINKPSWFSGNAQVGLIVETQDGTIQCENSGWLTELIRFATGGTDYQAIFNSVAHSPSNNDQSSSLSAYLSKYLFGGSTTSGNGGGGLSQSDIDAMRYQSLIYAFTSSQGCGATQKNLTPAQSEGTDETTVTIPYVDATGKLVNANFTYNNLTGIKDVPVGYSVVGSGTYECRDIAKALSNTLYAKDAAAWYAAQPGRTIGAGALTSNSNRKTCEDLSGLTLAWIVCPIIEFVDNIIAGLDTAIQNLLIIDKAQYDNPHVKQVFATMRNIALALIVPLMLLMVIGTALDFGPFDAYTVKKMFPRLAFAVLAIVLSYPFGVFMIEIANAASSGILGLISAAFGNGNTSSNTITLSSLLTGGESAEIFGALAVGTAVSAAVGTLTFGVLGSMALVAAAGLLIGFIVLMLWQILVIFGLVLLPIRWFLWSLGGVTGVGDKVDKLLWDGWLGALAFGFTFNTVLGVGRGFASMIADPSSGTNFGASLLRPAFVVVAYIGPFFLIKQIASASGAGLAMLSGAVNDRGKGFFDRQRKYRADSRAREGAKFQAGDRFRDRGLGRAINSVGRRVGVTKKYGMRDTGWGGLTNRSRYQAALGLKQDADAETKLKQDERLQQVKNNDDANNVLALSGGSYEGAREAARDLFTDDRGRYDSVRAERALAAAQAAGISRNSAAAAIKTSAENKWRAVGAGRIDTIDRGLARLSSNPSELSSMRYGAAALARGNGRGDLGGHWSDISFDASTPAGALHADMANRLATNLARGGPVTQSHRDEAQRQVRSHMTALEGMNRTTIHQMLNGHGNQSTAYANAVRFAMDYGDNGTTAGEELRLTAAQRALEIADNLSAANGDSQRDYRNFLFNGLGLEAQTVIPGPPGPGGAPTSIATPSIEQQLVTRAHLTGRALPGSAAGVAGNASVIRAGARVYNSPQAANSTAGSGVSGGAPSDIRLKRNVKALHSSVYGGMIPLYTFQYLWSDQVYVGVMAQDVVHIAPAAVTTDAYGFYMVDYGLIGSQMYTIEAWRALQTAPTQPD